MDGNLQIIAGILAVFFLGVAIAKSMAQRARKREAARSIAAQAAQEVSLHNPFAEKEEPATGETATQQGGSGKMREAATPQGESGKTEGTAEGESGEAESSYKWE